MPKPRTVTSDQEDNTQSNSRSLINSIRRQRNDNELHVKRIFEESQSIMATCTEDDSNQFIKVKLSANRDIVSSKVILIESFEEKLLDAIATEEDMEKVIFENSAFERSVSEMIICVTRWIKTHEEKIMSN